MTDVTDTWYFAYGSNLDPTRKELRTGIIREAKVACLHGYDFAFNKRSRSRTGCANIVQRGDTTVWGVIYRCSPSALKKLDGYEGVDGGDYSRVTIRVQCRSGEEVDAVTYIAGDSFVDGTVKPSAEYLQMVLRGARHHGLPDAYVRRIERAALEAGSEGRGVKGPA